MNKLNNSNTPTPPNQKKTVVLGVGNILLSDEGVGVHVANQLMEMALPPEVEVIEGGIDGLGLMSVMMRADQLIVIDAVKGGGPSGSIYRFDIEELISEPDLYKMSIHEISVLEVIRLSGLVGQTPKTIVIGIEPKSMETGMELTLEVEATVPKVIEAVFRELKGLGYARVRNSPKPS